MPETTKKNVPEVQMAIAGAARLKRTLWSARALRLHPEQDDQTLQENGDRTRLTGQIAELRRIQTFRRRKGSHWSKEP